MQDRGDRPDAAPATCAGRYRGDCCGRVSAASTRDDAEALAAREQGFADAEVLYRTLVDRWTREVDRLLDSGRENREAAEILTRARTFIREGWALQAVRLGWSEVELFGVSPGSSSGARDWTGGAFGGAVQAVTSDEIIRAGGRRTPRPVADPDRSAAMWDVIPHGR